MSNITAINSYNYHECYKDNIITKVIMTISLTKVTGITIIKATMDFTTAINFTRIIKFLINRINIMIIAKIKMVITVIILFKNC